MDQDSRIRPLFLKMLLNHAIVKNDFKTQQKWIFIISLNFLGSRGLQTDCKLSLKSQWLNITTVCLLFATCPLRVCQGPAVYSHLRGQVGAPSIVLPLHYQAAWSM